MKKHVTGRDELEYLIRQEAGNRTELGLFAFRYTSRNDFSYRDCIAIACLIKFGYNAYDAAKLVAHDIAYVAPRFTDHASDEPEGSDPVGRRAGGVYALADGSCWALFADNDIAATRLADLDGGILVVATRRCAIVDECPVDRVHHLVSEVAAPGLAIAA